MKYFEDWLIDFENDDFNIHELRIIRDSVNHRIDKLSNELLVKLEDLKDSFSELNKAIDNID